MISDDERRERVRAGSRRKRDLAVAGPEDSAAAVRRRTALAWAAKHLPSEHPPFVYAAYEAIRLSGLRPTPENVRARLIEQGRDHESLELLA